MIWTNNDLELVLDNSPLALNDLVAPSSIQTLRVYNHQLKHIRASKNDPNGK